MHPNEKIAAEVRAIMTRVVPIVQEVLQTVNLHTPGRVTQAGALVTALSALIEKEVGREKAADCLMCLLQPTMIDGATPHDCAKRPGTTSR